MVNAINAFENSGNYKLKKLKQACVDFEQIFLLHLLKAMYNTLPKDSLIPNNAENDIYRFMYLNAMAHSLAENSGLGIANMLYNSLENNIKHDNNKKISIKPYSNMQKMYNLKTNKMQKIKIDRKVAPNQGEIKVAIREASRKYHVEENLILAVIKAESDFDSTAISEKGAYGLMQLMPLTAIQMGVKNITNIYENIMGGTKYLAKLIERFGSKKLALAAYNAGPANVNKYNGVPPYKETQDYVERVLAYAREF